MIGVDGRVPGAMRAGVLWEDRKPHKNQVPSAPRAWRRRSRYVRSLSLSPKNQSDVTEPVLLGLAWRN